MAEELRLLQTQAELAEGRFARKDGRKFDEHRPIESTKGSIETADGSCLVRLGNTCVICGLRGEIAEKTLTWDRHVDIPIGVEVQLPFRNIGYSNPSDDEQKIAQQLQTLLVNNEVFRPKSISDRFYWTLHVTITCLDFDGNLFGAAVAAITGALSSLKLPTAVHDLDTDELNVDDCYEKVTSDQPIAVTYGIINDEVIVDMNDEESILAGSESHLVYSLDGTLLSFHKGGMTDVKRIGNVIELGKAHAVKLRKTLLDG